MFGWLRDNYITMVILVAVLGVAWTMVPRRLFHPVRRGSSLRVCAYCLHCNWEGKVASQHVVCAQCGSTSLAMVTV